MRPAAAAAAPQPSSLSPPGASQPRMPALHFAAPCSLGHALQSSRLDYIFIDIRPTSAIFRQTLGQLVAPSLLDEACPLDMRPAC